MTRVVILQHRLLHYRTVLFEQLRTSCAALGIDMQLVHGQATPREQMKHDEGHLPWAQTVKNRVWEIRDRDLIWQPFPKHLRDTDLIVMMQESRILSNYRLLTNRIVAGPRLAYWGHGANLQSHAPNGLRERWKRLLLTRVDWWFAYTQSTVDIVRGAGFPSERITCLNNSMDTHGFKRDLRAIREVDVEAARQVHGIHAGATVGLFCGSLYPDKRLELLVEAGDRIRDRIADFHCLVIGTGPSMPDLRDAAASRPWLHLLGPKKGPEKALYFRLASFMFNPGAIGLHIVDAFCGGLVLLTTAGAMHGPEIAYLRSGENAFITGNSATEYAEAVLRLVHDPALLNRVQAASLADAERYSLEHMVENFARGIVSCLESPRRP